MSTRPQSQLIGQFANVKVSWSWKDGEYITICKILRQEGTQFVVCSELGEEYRVEISDIRQLVNITEVQKYKVGDEVEAIVFYHWKDGDETDFGRITGVKQFGNNISYSVYVFKQNKIVNITQRKILRIVALQKAKYAQGQYIGVKHCDGHPYFYDEYIKNGTITSVNVGYDRVTYSVSYDDGTSETFVSESSITTPAVIKTAAQKEQEYAQYLQTEEQRLLQQLANVRSQMRH